MSDVGGEIAENCGFQGKILYEVPQSCDTPSTEYTPPDGYRVLQIGEVVQKDDIFLAVNGEHWPAKRIGETVNNNRYLRRTEVEQAAALEPCAPCDSGDTDDTTTSEQLAEIEGQSESEPQPQPVPEHLQAIIAAQAETIARLQSEAHELNMEIGGLQGDLSRRQARIRELETVHAEAAQAVVRADRANDKLRAQADELRSEVSHVQWLLDESRQRVTHLEELVSSLRAINEAQEKAFEAAGQGNTALRNQLAAVKAELVTQAETSRRLQIELDAAQQVPADSPELRQLRADLEQVTLGRDTYRDGYDRVLSDLRTIRETTKAETVEAIAEWLQPIRAAIAAADNVAESTREGWLAEEVIQHLPTIMRSLLALHHTTDTTNTSKAGQG